MHPYLHPPPSRGRCGGGGLLRLKCIDKGLDALRPDQGINPTIHPVSEKQLGIKNAYKFISKAVIIMVFRIELFVL